ncbi:uncharacterized protein LOC117224738 isoform X1 [Megalopta genalis]|uniref:uncharacterized protein LOC117224738 isoform X1 n=2 Tax=Megalopta genalis TaxID=115081 RepID=UPI003FD1205C
MSIGIVCQQMGKVSIAVRSAAMSHIEPRLTTILGRAKMRKNLVKIVVVLLLCGSGGARPQKTGESSQTAKPIADQWKPSSTPANTQDISMPQNDGQRHLKDLQYMDQSLRTVATQLLNVTNPEDEKTVGKIIKKSPNVQKSPEKDVAPSKEMTVNIGFGRPVNSKFSFFEASHPGHAMAITEEELEKELSSTRLMTAYKNHPTTTGGISTWILLNPPSTTIKTIDVDKKSKQTTESDKTTTTRPTTMTERIDATERVTEKVTLPVSTMLVTEEPPSTKKIVLLSTTKRTDPKAEKPSEAQATLKPPQTTLSFENKETTISATKKIQTVRTTPKPKSSTSKPTALSKPSILKTSRPNQPVRPKPVTRRTTPKPDTLKNDTASSAKIEKVTFRPVQMITVAKSKPDSTEKPMFVTKIKASVLMDTQKATTPAPVSSTISQEPATTMKSIISSTSSKPAEILTKLKPIGTKSNVLKVQLKKPAEDTKIEIEPIKVNAPVLKIEKVEKDKRPEVDTEKDALNDSQIDLKFDFNPELTKINTDTETSTSTAATVSSTTKRPRHSSKRKKNKSRRRKPSASTTTISPLTSSSTELELMTLDPAGENGIQESKIAPETKVSVNSTKTKKKQVQKPISTQIYNFLSREVMPSFGMMSLVGLGLGLASYFLYPFGGTIARRNYEVEPKYKYNLDEYGGNYGQSEEEVLSKVFQGMTTNDDNKYPGAKDYDNYYQYQHYDGGYDSQTTKKYEQRYTSSPVYRPENTGSALKFRNTDYRYPDAPSTPNYYERPKHTEYAAGQAPSEPANRQFVVGNVPKEYPSYEEKAPAQPTTGKLASYEPTESGPLKFDHDIDQNFNFNSPVQSYGQVQTSRPEEAYEEVEITPTAVAVEHGPRSLKSKRSVDGSADASPIGHRRSRARRDSVIQVIPSKRELEEEEKEEDLSNEILNIIDSALPGEEDGKTRRKETEISEELEAKKRRQKDEERIKSTAQASTESSVDVSSRSTGSSTLQEATDSSISSSPSSNADPGSISTEASKSTEQNNVEWIDMTTKTPEEQDGFSLFGFVKKVAEIKFRLGLTLLKHASEGFARYLGHVQKRINGEE